jgi:hypothetical protein
MGKLSESCGLRGTNGPPLPSSGEKRTVRAKIMDAAADLRGMHEAA